MKKLATILLLAIAACMITSVSHGDIIYNETVVNSGVNGTNNTVAILGTNAPETMIPVLVTAQTCTIETRHKFMGTGTSSVTFTVQKNDRADTTNWVTHGTFAVTSAGTTEAWGRTNITIGDYGYVRILLTNNNTLRAITNLSIRVYRKE